MSEFNSVVQEGANKVGKKIRRFLLWLLLAAVIVLGLYMLVCNMTYSRGTRSGNLIKLSHKGIVFKTYEGQLNLGGFQQDEESGVSGNIWNFSIWKDEIYDELQDLEGKKVKLHYRQKYKSMPWQGKTEYFIYDVEEVEED